MTIYSKNIDLFDRFSYVSDLQYSTPLRNRFVISDASCFSSFSKVLIYVRAGDSLLPYSSLRHCVM